MNNLLHGELRLKKARDGPWLLCWRLGAMSLNIYVENKCTLKA